MQTGTVIAATLASCGSAALAGFSLQYAWWRRPVDWSAPRVLMYHMVAPHRPGARFNKLRVPPTEFERQLAWLREQNFQFVRASELFSETPLPPRTVCLTFDDGFQDNLTAAHPLIEKYAACATLYLVVDRSGGWSSKKKAHHADDELQSEPKLTDAEVQLLLQSGRWELGGHTCTHANLAKCDAATALEEISRGKSELEARFRVSVPTFAYPFGIYDSTHAQLVKQAGFRGAVTTTPEIARHPYANPLEVPRVKVSGTEGLFAFRMRMNAAKRGLLK